MGLIFATPFQPAIRMLSVGKMSVRFAGFLPGVDTFDAALFR